MSSGAIVFAVIVITRSFLTGGTAEAGESLTHHQDPLSAACTELASHAGSLS